jgi:hypothetical protein
MVAVVTLVADEEVDMAMETVVKCKLVLLQ